MPSLPLGNDTDPASPSLFMRPLRKFCIGLVLNNTEYLSSTTQTHSQNRNGILARNHTSGLGAMFEAAVQLPFILSTLGSHKSVFHYKGGFLQSRLKTGFVFS